MYSYRAYLVRVVDADTVYLDVDLGFNTWIKNEPFRLAHIDAWETRGEEKPQGLLAKDALIEKLGEEPHLFISTIKDKKGKYGRYIATILLNEGDEVVNINDWLVDFGHAEYREY